jgi:hypothetical protein
MPELLAAYFSSGSLVDAVLNLGLAAPIDVQVGGTDLHASYASTLDTRAADPSDIHGVADAYIPQDLDYPALTAGYRSHARRRTGPERKGSGPERHYRADLEPDGGAQYLDRSQEQQQLLPERAISRNSRFKSLLDLRSIPLHGVGLKSPTRLDMVSNITRFEAPTEVDHYQIRRVLDIYVRPLGEGLGDIADQINGVLARTKLPAGVDVTVRGMVEGMRSSFRSFALGLTLSVLLLYLILVAQFRSFIDPLIILLAFPPALTGVLLTLVD